MNSTTLSLTGPERPEFSGGKPQARRPLQADVRHLAPPVRMSAMLIASLDGEPEPGVAAAWDAEVENRVREADAGKARMVDGKTVKAEISKVLKRG